MQRMNQSDREQMIIDMGRCMIEYDWRLLDIAANFMCSLTTVYKSLTNDLKLLDHDLYAMCKKAMNAHKHNHIPRGRRY